LKFAWGARSTTDHAEVAVLDSGIRVSKIQVIDEVERFGAYLQGSLVSDVNCSEERDIRIDSAWAANDAA
jgi:hypothetical protein